MYDSVGRTRKIDIDLKKYDDFIPLKERYMIIGDIFLALGGENYGLSYISEKVSQSSAISANFIRYIKSNKVYSVNSLSEKEEPLDVISSGLKRHGINPLIEVLLNARETKIPDVKLDHFSLLSNNVHKFLKENFSQRSNLNSYITPTFHSNSRLYAQLYGIEALIYLELDYQNKNKLDQYPVDSHNFDREIHTNARSFGERFNFPSFLMERGGESQKIQGVLFSYATISEVINCFLGLKGISFLNPSSLILSEKTLKENQEKFEKRLKHFVSYNSQLEPIWNFEIDSQVYSGENGK
jgi:hypothetical protein